jgi:hypothetical protein
VPSSSTAITRPAPPSSAYGVATYSHVDPDHFDPDGEFSRVETAGTIGTATIFHTILVPSGKPPIGHHSPRRGGSRSTASSSEHPPCRFSLSESTPSLRSDLLVVKDAVAPPGTVMVLHHLSDRVALPH